ncbi:MAG: NACHT domain-containing protein, partial [Caldilineae bacterium]
RRRLRTIAAPPGYGKTWLLHELERRLREKNRDDLFIIWVPTSELTSRGKIIEWLPGVIAAAQEVCPDVRGIAPGDSPQTAIDRLLEDLSQGCSPPRRVLLFVDGLDEISEAAQKELARHLLEPFWQDTTVRMVISFRDDYSLKSHLLRRGEKRIFLPPFSRREGETQLDKRARLAGETLPIAREELLARVEPYPLNVPGINTILSQRIKQNEAEKRAPLLSADDLHACWRELVGPQLSQMPQDATILEEDLRHIVELEEDTWTLEDFAEKCNYTQTDAYYHIQSLLALTVVVQAGGPLYKVADGLRELLRAERRLKDEEETP